MKYSIWIFLFLWLLSFQTVGAQEATEPPSIVHSGFVPDGYTLIFSDEFNQIGLDTTQWRHRYVNRPYLAGYNSEESIEQPGDGYLHLITRHKNDQFLTGMIQSIEEFQYGYFEARIRFQSLQGHHGAFWLQSPLYGQYLDDPGQSGAEIDIIEFFGTERSQTDAQHNVHWNPYASEAKQQVSHDLFYRQEYGDELSGEFHIFALQWTEDEYIFFIDGVETWRTSEGLSHVPQYIVLSLITSAWENARLDIQQLPDEMLVDYVRVYTD